MASTVDTRFTSQKSAHDRDDRRDEDVGRCDRPGAPRRALVALRSSKKTATCPTDRAAARPVRGGGSRPLRLRRSADRTHGCPATIAPHLAISLPAGDRAIPQRASKSIFRAVSVPSGLRLPSTSTVRSLARSRQDPSSYLVLSSATTRVSPITKRRFGQSPLTCPTVPSSVALASVASALETIHGAMSAAAPTTPRNFDIAGLRIRAHQAGGTPMRVRAAHQPEHEAVADRLARRRGGVTRGHSLGAHRREVDTVFPKRRRSSAHAGSVLDGLDPLRCELREVVCPGIGPVGSTM